MCVELADFSYAFAPLQLCIIVATLHDLDPGVRKSGDPQHHPYLAKKGTVGSCKEPGGSLMDFLHLSTSSS